MSYLIASQTLLDQMNENYAVIGAHIKAGSSLARCRVARVSDKHLMSLAEFKRLFCQTVILPDGHTITLGKWWLQQFGRRQHTTLNLCGRDI